MSSQAPGKTAPKLLSDFYAFDPLSIYNNYNILTDPPPVWHPETPQPPKSLRLGRKDSCKHEYITQLDQSLLPKLDERPKNGTVWKIAAVCKTCRLHATVLLDYRKAGRAICPVMNFPLHHFNYDSTDSSQTAIHCHFKCTSWACQAALTISYAQSVMDPDSLELLTNQDNLKQRYRAILAEDPERKDVSITTPTDALYRLKRYIDDSLKPTHDKRQFPAHNKKFLGAFGQDCHDFLSDLGFKYVDSDSGGKMWQLPNPGLTVDPLRPDQSRVRLANLSCELQILIDQMCLREGTPNPSMRDPWRDVHQDLERLLSVQAYDKQPSRNLGPTEQDHPSFGVLGALGDFSDSLIFFAYERQVMTDFDNVPYYFDCLREIAQGRQSESLIIKISEISANGVVGRSELVAAYKDLGVTSDLSTAKTMDDNYLVDIYRALVTDCGPERRTELRRSLQKIGQQRNSGTIANVASDSVETYEEALAFLGAEKDTNDEMITVLYATKVGDSADNMDWAKTSVKIIADKRQSEALREFINTGEMNTYEMDLDEACRHLQMTFDPTVDEEVLNSIFLIAQSDSPGKRTDQAIGAVRKAYQERNKIVAHAAETWPVGLESHGNTCYLNSLLQYYFTIKPLRDLVLSIDRHKFDLQAHNTKSERVQSIHLKRYEIEAYQIFADHLKLLFQRMIQARGPTVKPDTELVCGAFLKPNEPKAVREIGKEGASVDSLDADMGGTNPKTEELKVAPAAASVESLDGEVGRKLSNASSATLIEEEQQQQQAPSASSQTLITPPASPKADPPEPQKKPPLPPRPNLERAKTQLELAQEAATRQQDVAEVMEDLLRRLRAAIKPEGEDAQGEQLDQLRNLFNMRFVENIISGGEKKIKEEEDATNILLNVPYEPTDIYTALDRVIDLRPDEIAGKRVETYRSFTGLPPLLQISVPRIALRNGSAVKVTDSLRLEETLYLDRYCENPSVLPIRQRCWQMRKRLENLKVEKELLEKTSIDGMNGPDVLDNASKYFTQVQETNVSLEALGIEPFDLPSDLPYELEQEAVILRARLGPLNDEIRQLEEGLKGQFDAFTEQKYRLYAVFFHRGSAGGGHYWSNIFDFKNNMWRTYNDETVEEHKSSQDILNAHEWAHGTPTYAVYVRDDVKDDFVEPLCRAPEAEAEVVPDILPDDVQMSESQANINQASFTDATVDRGSKGAQDGWDDSNGSCEPGNVTPQKRSSDSDDHASSPKRTAVKMVRMDGHVETVSSSAFQHGPSALDVRYQTQVMDEDADNFAD